MRLGRSFALLTITLATFTGQIAIAQETAAGQNAAATERRAILEATEKFVKAFNAGDVKTMSELWTPGGDFIGENGDKVIFHKQLEGRTGKLPQGVKEKDAVRPSLVMTIDSIRFVTPAVATVDGSSVFRHFPGAPGVHGRYTATWVHGNDKQGWLLDSVRENHIEAGAHHTHLMELDWMLGEWTGSANNATIESKLAWSADGNYLERTFHTNLPGRGEQRGMQRIGWDPKRGQFRSWTFGSDGSFSQGLWEETENGFAIEVSGVTANGKSTGSLTKINRIDANTIEWESTEATQEGEALPDLKIKLVRKPSKQ